jgi:hypothetical protein
MKFKENEFSFSDDNIQKIRELNIKLKNEEVRILAFSIQLQNSITKLMNDKVIDEFNFDSSLSIYSSDPECNKRNNSCQGNPIWEVKDFSLFKYGTDDVFYSDNWNELPKDHPLGNESFCYSMHCIWGDSGLTWQDIVDIDAVWIDLKVDYQFFFE